MTPRSRRDVPVPGPRRGRSRTRRWVRTRRARGDRRADEAIARCHRRPDLRSAAALLHRAFQADDPAEVARLARQSLEIWPDCADAYVLLAEQARGPQEALDLYALGVEAAERDLGPEAFRDAVGHFWGALPTRPYMRPGTGWPSRSGSWADAPRPSSTIRKCSGSTLPTTRASATTSPPVSSSWAATTTFPSSWNSIPRTGRRAGPIAPRAAGLPTGRGRR